MIPSDWLDLAARRLHGQIQHTPLTYDPELNIYLKWENRQKTGSFKIRGALNKVLSLESWELQRGLVTASAGNHGQGVAYAASLVGAPVVVFASEHAVPAKVEAMRALGADVRLVPGGYEAAEQAGIAFAAENERVWISPYNDGQVIAGQATVGLEVLEQLRPQVPAVIAAPVGGGGLAVGIGAAVERVSPRPYVIGVQSVASPFFYALFTHGTQHGVVELDSLADGLAGAVESGSITVPLARRLLHEILLVTEEEVSRAVAYAWRRYAEKIEGAAAVTLAAALNGSLRDRCPKEECPLVVIISGGNIQPEVHAQIVERYSNNR